MEPVVRPMRAAKVVLESLNYPVLASPKFDGIRAIIVNGVVMSNNMKAIRNRHVQKLFGKKKYNGLDGELIVGSPTAKDCYNVTNSGVMSEGGEPDVRFYAFDFYTHYDWGFNARRGALIRMLPISRSFFVVEQTMIDGEGPLLHYERMRLLEGYEGVMLRSADGIYKFGRSTMREGLLMKLKRFEDGEAVVLGAVELNHNHNALEKDELGRAKRSSNAAGKVAGGTMGALAVKDLVTGVAFEIGTGFTAGQRQTIWNDRGNWLGKIVKYKYLAVGVKDRPRHPVFLGLRHEEDLCDD